MRKSNLYCIIAIFLISTLVPISLACDEIPLADDGLPEINHFYADPQEVLPAASAILHWDVSEASTVTIEPDVGEVAPSGEQGVAPLENTTYILTASNEVGTVTAATEVFGNDLIATVVEGSSSVELPVLSESSELPEPPDQTAVLLVDPENRPMWRAVDDSESTALIEPHTVEPIDELPSDETPSVLPIIRRFEAVGPYYWYFGSYYRLYFEVLNSSEMDIYWAVDGVWQSHYLHRRSSGYTDLVYNDPDEGLFFCVYPNRTRTFTLGARGAYGTSLSRLTIYIGDDVPAAITPVPSLEPVPPTINYFTANPETITKGSYSKLSWDVSNTDTVSITGLSLNIVASPSGSVSVSPSSTTKYKLTATNSGGSRSQTVAVYVEESIPSDKVLLPIIHSFTANPTNIPVGDSSKLSWEVSNADTITITAVSMKETVASTGSLSISPSNTTTYKLTAMNKTGSQSQSITITVEQPKALPPPEEKAKPDLVITDIRKVSSTEWYYMIKNQGKVECKASTSELIINGKARVEQNIGSLDAGESREFYFSHKFTCESGTSHTWSVVADSDDIIAESDEKNNLRTEKFICSK
ncbi:MAG: hypothetical protein JSU79_05825 [Dehalococcoidales bacterium]|nr:MAG: hypothetical protein JSU79_05825 [Dehalococcoidales bacterium]